MRRKKALSFKVTGEYITLIQDLKERVNADSKAEVLRTALSILDWAIDNINQGYRIVAISKEDEDDWDNREPDDFPMIPLEDPDWELVKVSRS